MTMSSSCRRCGAGKPEAETFAAFLGRAHVAGVPVDWSAFYAGSGARRIELPTYAFQHERYWLMPATGNSPAASGQAGLDHPMLTAAVQVGDRDEWVFTGRLSQEAQPWVRDHVVLGLVLLPGAALVELALTAGAQAGAPVVDELVLEAPLVVPDDAAVQLQVTVGAADEDGRREVAIYSRAETADEDGERAATCHARGAVVPAATELVAQFPAQWPPAGAEPVAVDALYLGLADVGYDYGPLFQGLRAAWRDGEIVYSEVVLPDGAADPAFGVHPALLDAALHGGLLGKEPGSATELPFSWSGVRLGTGTGSRVRVRITPAEGSAVRVDVLDEAGALVVSVAELAVRPVDPAQLESAQRGGQSSLFRLDWVPVPVAAELTARVAVLGDIAGEGDRFPDLHALEQALADGAAAPDLVVVRVPAVDSADVAAAAGLVAARTLGLLQRWLAVSGWRPPGSSSSPSGGSPSARSLPIPPRRRPGAWCGARSPSIRTGSCSSMTLADGDTPGVGITDRAGGTAARGPGRTGAGPAAHPGRIGRARRSVAVVGAAEGFAGGPDDRRFGRRPAVGRR